jgi:hypothetical protein
MTEKTKKYLSDILIAIALIRDFTVDISDFNFMIMTEKLKVP